ncbi:hypothetical protein BKM20_22765 [Pseudomonas avellanae]|uniref:Uncharacterized protein n=2 Tax=Pseudomonas syringae group TaxID=136849 RepID=A0A2K4W7A9_9PSED|nr:hypothetical protein AL055_24855 [Pseudomonas amygdali pv. morsprunorum]PHN37442.1 hypothetical protein AO261_09235 [Pseudomonas avellanae]SOS31778.1 hypothetical protein CFBP6411_00409 [Pseudomonas syringae group genomosp. 3]POC84447.1 hypothetical protein BKM26_23350 [Pseudomonas avellanae]POD02874.1 hypothetical protein BKM20_22765 [Pseudomonas avellanae]
MPICSIRKRQFRRSNHGLLLICHQQRANGLIVLKGLLGQQVLISTQQSVLDLPLNLRGQKILLIKTAHAVAPGDGAVGQSINRVVVIDAQHSGDGGSNGSILWN